MPHPAPPRALVEAVRARYPLWQNLSLDNVAQARQHPLPWLLKTIEEMYDSRTHDPRNWVIAGGDRRRADRRTPVPDTCKATAAGKAAAGRAEKAAWEVMQRRGGEERASPTPVFNRDRTDPWTGNVSQQPDGSPFPSRTQVTPPSIFCALQPRLRRRGAHVLPLPPTLLQECSPSDGSHKLGADSLRRGIPVPDVPGDRAHGNRPRYPRSVFGKNGGGVLYQAVRQLITDYFRERRDAIESEASSEPYAEKPKATMEAYYYLKLMLSAYRDTRPDDAIDDGEFSDDDEEYEEEAVYRASFDASPQGVSKAKDWSEGNGRTGAAGDSTVTPPTSFVTAQQKMEGGRGVTRHPRMVAAVPDSESPAAESAAAADQLPDDGAIVHEVAFHRSQGRVRESGAAGDHRELRQILRRAPAGGAGLAPPGSRGAEAEGCDGA